MLHSCLKPLTSCCRTAESVVEKKCSWNFVIGDNSLLIKYTHFGYRVLSVCVSTCVYALKAFALSTLASFSGLCSLLNAFSSVIFSTQFFIYAYTHTILYETPFELRWCSLSSSHVGSIPLRVCARRMSTSSGFIYLYMALSVDVHAFFLPLLFGFVRFVHILIFFFVPKWEQTQYVIFSW